MSSADLLQDVHDRELTPKPVKLRLFAAHILAIVCFGYLGTMIAIIFAMPTFKSLDTQARNINDLKEKMTALSEVHSWKLIIDLAGYSFLLIGGIISFFICKKQKLSIIVPVSIFLYSIILFWVLSNIPAIAYLMPGPYVLRYLGLNIGPIINVVYLAAIAWILFFSKWIRNWWLRPVIK